jgi:hypothetical protein
MVENLPGKHPASRDENQRLGGSAQSPITGGVWRASFFIAIAGRQGLSFCLAIPLGMPKRAGVRSY